MISYKKNDGEAADNNEFEKVPLQTRKEIFPFFLENEEADFESAILATGFGKFNIILFVIVIQTEWAYVVSTTALSYIVPIAQCDLELSLKEKGYLMSIPFLGMVITGPFWGFLSDTYGRKRIIIGGLMVNAFFGLLSGLSQNFAMIIFTNIMAGSVISGPIAATVSQVSEFFCAKYRARALLYMGIAFALGFIMLPLMGMFLLSKEMHFDLLFLKLHSWNLFLLICAIPAIIGSISQIFIPESPKFLMTAGRNDEALQVFRKIYAINTGKPINTFPINKLVEERVQKNHWISTWKAFKNGFVDKKSLFALPNLPKLLLVSSIEMCLILSRTSLKMWLPQIFAAINDYKATHNDEDANICIMLQTFQPNITKDAEKVEECVVNYENTSVYTNVMILSSGLIVGYFAIGTLINILGKKRLFVTLGTVAGISAMSLYFSENVATTIALSAIFTAVIGLNNNVIMTIIVDCFPTTLRTVALSISLTLGRSGAVMGNLVMPHLLTAGCLPPFLFTSLTALLTAILALFLPNTDMKALE